MTKFEQKISESETLERLPNLESLKIGSLQGFPSKTLHMLVQHYIAIKF